MDAQTFLTALKQRLQKRALFRQDEHKLNEGSKPPWITKEREGYTVGHAGRYFAVKWTVSEVDGKQRVSVLAHPLSYREEIAGPNQSVTLQSENERDGCFFVNPPNNPRRRDAVAQAFAGQSGFPRIENRQTLLGSINDADFLGRLLDVAAAGAVEDAGSVPAPQLWAEGTNRDDTNMVKESPSLNTILYGPPGTGKTYHSIARGVEIIDGSIAKDRAEVQRRFRELCDEERIAFITFHQSYGYEDFVEGIRPVLDIEEEGAARYELAAGVFKRIAIEALFDSLEQAGAAIGADFDARWEALGEQIEGDPERTYPGLSPASEFRLSLGPSGLIRGANVKSSKDSPVYICPKHYVEQVFAAFPIQQTVTTTDVSKTLDHGAHTNFVAAIFGILKQIEARVQEGREIKGFDKKAQIVQRFLKRGQESGYRLKDVGGRRSYVLIIDEINRGNISKIFGELITLLEPDKRLGAPVEITVTLPYSKERFVVPPNLFVLGTMNTADKSLALLDIALRRRFEFEELQPSFSTATCPALPEDSRRLLNELNHRIALRKDRDHLIGHSYFRDVKDGAGFNNVFKRRVIPLLQEYFFNDWDGLRAVLGEDKAPDGADFIRTLSPGNASWARTRWQWFHDCGGDIDCYTALLTNYGLLSATTHASGDADPND